MAYQKWLADVARAAGLNVVEVVGWETRGSSTFTPQFLIAHHTAIDSDAASVKVVRDGRPDLAGPLSAYVLGKDGTVYVIAAGRSNHAGEGSWKGLSGNTNSIGIEAVNKGDGTPWPAVQLDAYYRLSAAILKQLKKSAAYVCGHKEYAPGRKIDPKGIEMNDFRNRVAALMTEVQPMYSPPLDLGNVVAFLSRPGGAVVLNDDGAVYAFGCRDAGAPNRHPEYWTVGVNKAVNLYPLGESGYYVISKGASSEVGSAGWYAYP